MEVLYKQETYNIVGALMTVHRSLGCGFLEPVYQDAVEIEFKSRGIPFEREKEFDIYYKNIKLSQTYIADFVCYDKIIVELKAVDDMIPKYYAQTLNYMKITGFKLGLLANFGNTKLDVKRIVREQGW